VETSATTQVKQVQVVQAIMAVVVVSHLAYSLEARNKALGDVAVAAAHLILMLTAQMLSTRKAIMTVQDM
jgi:hypothetical protein